jgi:hypothetical protein
VVGLNARVAGAAVEYTVTLAVPVALRLVPVTTYVPPTDAVQTFALHDPDGAIAKLVAAVTSPVLFPYASTPAAVNILEPPPTSEGDAGLNTRLEGAAAVTVREELLVALPLLPVTRYVPATVAVQEFTVHDAPVAEPEPSGAIVKLVARVTTETTPFPLSPVAPNVVDPPATIVAEAGVNVR